MGHPGEDNKGTRELKFPGGVTLPNLRPKHRYFHATGPAEHCAAFCQKLEDEGMEILSVSDFLMPQPNGFLQMAGITARISRDLPLTPTEHEVDAAAKQMVKPVKGRIIS